ncbi:MAG: hypothetical protein CMN76_11775 [Spirochaetaceae bacterium]|nr:hypothetical protein [Spirochaetaceae bacterium]|tara:strand:+ start:69526 stop:70512 length:987 start_codon:yes stop_codon:yes gene_type:complete
MKAVKIRSNSQRLRKSIKALACTIAFSFLASHCQVQSGEKDETLELAFLATVLNGCTANSIVAVTSSRTVYEGTSPDSLAVNPELSGFSGSLPYHASVSTDGQWLALNVLNAPASALPGVLLFSSGTGRWALQGSLPNNGWDLRFFRFSGPSSGHLSIGTGSTYRVHTADVSGNTSLVFDYPEVSYGPYGTTSGRILFASPSLGIGDIGLYDYSNGVIGPLFEEASQDVSWFTASPDGSVIAYLVSGVENRVFVQSPLGIQSFTTAELNLTSGPGAFDLTDDGRFLVSADSGGNLYSMDLTTGKREFHFTGIAEPVETLDVPCGLPGL